MISKFEARTAEIVGLNVVTEPIMQTWQIPKGTMETGNVYWEEEDGWFHLETYQASETYAEVYRFSSDRRVVILDAEAWILEGSHVAMSLYIVMGHLLNERGLFAWDHTHALWITAEVEWYSGQIASDELNFTEISSSGFAYGTGYSAVDGKVQKIKLDLENQKVIHSAHEATESVQFPSIGTKIRDSALYRFVKRILKK